MNWRRTPLGSPIEPCFAPTAPTLSCSLAIRWGCPESSFALPSGSRSVIGCFWARIAPSMTLIFTRWTPKPGWSTICLKSGSSRWWLDQMSGLVPGPSCSKELRSVTVPSLRPGLWSLATFRLEPSLPAFRPRWFANFSFRPTTFLNHEILSRHSKLAPIRQVEALRDFPKRRGRWRGRAQAAKPVASLTFAGSTGLMPPF